MALSLILLVLSLSLFSYQVPAGPSVFRCKPLPGDLHWPTHSEWQALNSSVYGRLVKPVPPGAVCHPSWPQFDDAKCELVSTRWGSTSFHYKDPETSDYNDETCLPDPSAPCSDAGYPSYVVKAANVEDVQNAVEFAKNTGVRLIVKGTGHDFSGRSSGADSLSIYTRNLQGIEIVKKLKSSSPTTPAALLKAYAGERNKDLLNFAAEHDLTIISGADPHVGIGGVLQGGGHGPLTAKYGLAADQVVELEVVTANGEHLTINEDNHSDLFWAMRGAGGSTYAVIISATLKAYPSTSVTEYLFSYNTTSDTDSFWSLNAYFHSQLPRLSEAGVMGYYFVTPLAPGVHNESIQGQVSGQFLAPGLSVKDVEHVVKPMEDHLSNAEWADPVYVSGVGVEHPDFTKWWAQSEPQDAGYSGRLGSRLLDGKALTSDVEELKAALSTTTPVPWNLLGHLTAGPGTHNPPNGIPGGSNAVALGWRKAYTHIVLPRIWTPLNATEMKEITTDLREIRVPALRAIAPETGAYVNEIDPTEMDWKETMYGEHYSRLLEIKLRYDPSGVFWCKDCVGSDLWREIGPYGIENGIGQNRVRLCR